MKLFGQLVKLELAAAIGLVAYVLHKDSVAEQKRKVLANLSKDELLTLALMDSKYRDDYALFRKCMSDDVAADLVINNWLIHRGLISYRN